MKKIVILIALSIIFINSSISQNSPTTKIKWDSWGVPHISSDNIEDLFFAQGWAQMQNHGNLIIELYGTSRGRGSEYWGKRKLTDDMLIHTLGFPELAKEWEASQDPQTRIMFTSFVKGLNAYAEAHPEAIEEHNKKVLPLTTTDVNMHSMYVVFTRFIAGGDLGRVQRWPDLGSNGYAIGPKKSASGNAMLVQNPHLPWFGEFLFFESHLMLNDRNMYGTTLVGLPGIAIGFNKNLGWTHTNNVIDNSDLYELNLKDGGYLIDGNRHDFQMSQKTIKIKLENDSLIDQIIPIMKTKHGPVVRQVDDKVLALRMVGLDKPNMILQWWNMINSTNFEEFESALQMGQIPFWNVLYADKTGTIFYLFNGLVPRRADGDWAYWDRIIPSGKSSDIWTETHSYAELPKLKNPKSGWLQNANDPPWTSTIPQEIFAENYAPYMSPIRMPFRPQRSAKMLKEDESITFEELQDYKHSTRLEFADRILDDLNKAVENSISQKAKEAMVVLNKWDRTADAHSEGTLLFYNWAKKFNVWNDNNYLTKWNSEMQLSTPDGLADPESAVTMLENAAIEIETKFGSLSKPWGEYYRISYNGKNLAGNGIEGSMGVFRVAWPGRITDDNIYIGGGDSWVGVIEFGDTPKAKVLLSYGNSTQKNSPHFGDQLELFSKKEFRDAWFTREQVDANVERTEILKDGTFITD